MGFAMSSPPAPVSQLYDLLADAMVTDQRFYRLKEGTRETGYDQEATGKLVKMRKK
jgi:hypothetical protein